MGTSRLLRRSARGAAQLVQQVQPRSPQRALFNSFHGKHSDNPRAVHDRLRQRHFEGRCSWIADDPHATFAGADAVVAPYSVRYLLEAGRAGIVVSNVQMPHNYVKSPGAVYVQTWHGTPLKRLGLDNERWQANRAGWAAVSADYRKWDFLVTQNAYSTEIFRRAFLYEGPVLEIGYPRNDILSSASAPDVRERTRTALGIDRDQKVILYAPTWRDDLLGDDGRHSFSLQLDVERLLEAAGPDCVLLLRMHYAVATRVASQWGPRVQDVSDHSDISELYLAADALITDYSSVMFDFVVTGKPIAFFTFDLARYRDDVRGFYFDFEAEAPGPVCRSNDELLEALPGLLTAERDVDRYDRFRSRFCALDDGGASDRLIDRALGSRVHLDAC